MSGRYAKNEPGERRGMGGVWAERSGGERGGGRDRVVSGALLVFCAPTAGGTLVQMTSSHIYIYMYI